MASVAPTFPSTKETTNYARLCRLLVDVGTHVLRETLDKIHPPANLYAVLARPAEHAVLQALRKKRALNPTQWGKIYPAIKSSVSSRDFDITLLMVLLRNICSLAPPTSGWDNLPAATNVTRQDDIARVKFYRNTVYGHASQASVDDAAFGTYWKEIRDTLVRLGGSHYGAAIDVLKDDCMDPDIEKHYQELLKQWKKDEDNFKDKLDKLDEVAQELSRKLDGLKTSIDNPERKTPVNEQLDVERCQAQLHAHYNTMSHVKRTPWNPENTMDIEDIYTRLSWFKDEGKGKENPKTKLEEYTDIFKGHKRFTNPKRMLVYGRPGIGKSTFSQKIAVDWANGEKEALKKFDLLLLIKLRDVCGIQDLPSIIKASKLLTKDGPVSIESLYEYVLQNQEKVLLVFDGYDEYDAEESSTICEIWEGNQLRDCHVIVTTREMEGERLIKYSHVRCEIRGFDSKEQVNKFASTFITNPKEIDEFDRYLDSGDLWEIAEIPLLLLMLCLIWMDRHTEALPKSKLELHERFVKTLLLHMTIKDPKDSKGEHLYTILDDYREDLTEIGKLALDGLLRNVLYVDLKDSKLERSSFNDKMIRSGLFQFSKLTSGEPDEKLFFLHKSVHEFFAAWYIMNEAGLKDGKLDCFKTVNSFEKALHLQETLEFICQWSDEGAKAVFSLLKFIGEKEELTECHFTKAPSVKDLSSDQINFRHLALECLLACSASSKQVVYSTFMSSISGIVSMNRTLKAQKLLAENQLLSTTLPSYIFLNFVDDAEIPSILDALNVVIITRSGRRLNASNYFRTHHVYSGDRYDGRGFVLFFLRKEGEVMCLYFTHICIVDTSELVEMFKDLTASFSESEKKQPGGDDSNDEVHTGNSLNVSENTVNTSYYKKQNCLSLVSKIYWPYVNTSEELTVLSDVLSAAAFPQIIKVNQFQYRLFDAQVVKNMVSHISITDNLSVLQLARLNLTADDAAVIVRSLHRAPNLQKLDLSDSPLYGHVSELAENLHHVPRLMDLKLSRVGMGGQECESLTTSLKHVPKLETLCLILNPLGSGIIRLSEHLKSVPCLKELWLSKTNMGEEEVTALAHALTCVPELQKLYVDGNPLGRGVSVLVQNFNSLANRRRLDLQRVVMTEKQLDDVATANRRNLIVTSYYDNQGNLKPECEWPVMEPYREWLSCPMRGSNDDGYF